MIWLSGAYRPELEELGIGFLYNPHMGNRPLAHLLKGYDNSCFGKQGPLSEEEFYEWLDSNPRENCIFATAYDVVGNHAETLARSRPMLPQIRRLGYAAAFVLQDGAAVDEIPWDEFDVAFIGGTDNFKLGASIPGLVMEARRRGKGVHMGRVNSYRRLRIAKLIGCNWADGTMIKFAPDINRERVRAWLARLHAEPLLDFRP